MDKLKDFSTKELEQELKKRLSLKPLVKVDIDWSPVINYIKNNVVKKYPMKDYEHILFEIVMEAMYGDNVWVWWNNKDNDFQSEK